MNEAVPKRQPGPLPRAIGQPATRALLAAGVTSLDHLTMWRRAELQSLHGVGPRAIGVLEQAMADAGMRFRADQTTT